MTNNTSIKFNTCNNYNMLIYEAYLLNNLITI